MMLRRMVLAFALLLCLQWAPSAQGQDLLSKFHPYISLSEEYNDNVMLTAEDKKEDYITTVQPGLRFSNMDKVSGVELDYSLMALFYSKNSDFNFIGHNALLNAKYLTESHFNFYLRDYFIRSDVPREQEYFTAAEENRQVLATRTERSVFWRNVVEPKIEYLLGPENRLGLTYRNNIYRTESETGQNSQENYVNPFFSYWFDKRNGISLEYGLTLGEFENDPDLTGHKGIGRYTNRLSSRFSVFTEYAYSKRTFDSPDAIEYDIHEPSVGIAYTFGPSLAASAQIGYYWMTPEIGDRDDGITYKGELANTDPRTTFRLSVQGGYTEDYFTAENLGFTRYHRLTGFLTHLLDKRVSVGCFGNLERAEFEGPVHTDTIWGIGGTASYTPLKWLTLSLAVSHRDRQSDVELYEYTENRAMLNITATY